MADIRVTGRVISALKRWAAVDPEQQRGWMISGGMQDEITVEVMAVMPDRSSVSRSGQGRTLLGAFGKLEAELALIRMPVPVSRKPKQEDNRDEASETATPGPGE